MYREQEFHFVYEDGVLKPQEALDLPEGARGIAHIRDSTTRSDSRARTRALEIIRRVGESGVLNSDGQKMTREQMHERD